MRLVGDTMDTLDLEKWHIGEVPMLEPRKHLKNLPMMKIVLGARKSRLTIYGAESGGVRPRVTSYKVSTRSLPIEARELALKWNLLRKNIEVTHENT